MRKNILLLATIAGLGLSGVAFAATTTAGTIKSIDAKALSVTLDNGSVYVLPAGFKADSLKVGEKVTIVWDMNGKAYEAETVTKAS
jgi:Cu/Ag efflux protein CusF